MPLWAISAETERNRHGLQRTLQYWCQSNASFVEICGETKYRGRSRRRVVRKPFSMIFVRYPHRYFVNISSHIQWYRERGVHATAVIIMRDSTIALIGKASHCPNEQVAAKQNEHAWELAREAIIRLDPSNEIVLVSYEGLMSLHETYLFDFYRRLGINSINVPDFEDGNAKYVVPDRRRPTSSKMTHGLMRYCGK